jgi:pSer/pThr/pTyr-binding forkhead associated (FHA) protein
MDSLELRVVNGVDAGMRLRLGDGGFIGVSSVCQFRLSDLSVHAIHASIRPSGGCYVLTDVSEGSGLQVNGLPVRSRPLQAGDRIRLGSVDIEVEAVAPPVVERAARPLPAASPPPEKQQVRVEPNSPAGSPVVAVSMVILAIVGAVAFALCIHLISLRKAVEKQYTEVSELARAGRMTSWQALERYRGILPEAEEVHPQMAERLKAAIRSIEATMLVPRQRTQTSDAVGGEPARRGERTQTAVPVGTPTQP